MKAKVDGKVIEADGPKLFEWIIDRKEQEIAELKLIIFKYLRKDTFTAREGQRILDIGKEFDVERKGRN